MSNSAEQFPFTREFARALVDAYSAVLKVAEMANTKMVFALCGQSVTVGSTGHRRIATRVDDALIHYAYGEDDAK